MEFLVFITTVVFILVFAKADARRDRKRKKDGTYIPPSYYKMMGGFAPKTREFRKWERGRELAGRRAKERKRKGRGRG